MNKKIIKTVALAGAITACSLGFVGCGPSDNKTSPEYSIYNYDNSYYVNENFSLNGAKLKIKQKDGSYQEITLTNDMIKSMPDMTLAGTKTIVVVYNNTEYSLTIEVVANQELSYNFTGFESAYQVGDTFDITNLKLNIVYSSGNEQISVTSSMINSLPDMETEGLKTVQVNYNGKVYSFTFSVLDTSRLEMINKLNKFLTDYDTSKAHDSKLTINANGLAKYLENNAEFDEDILKIISSSDDFKSVMESNLIQHNENGITIANTSLAESIYSVIINSIINSVTDIQDEDIISAKDQLKAKVDVLKMLNNIMDNVTNVDCYDYFVNQLLLPNSAIKYANSCTNYICELLGIQSTESKNNIIYVLTNDIRAVKNNEIDLDSAYNMIIELNNVLQASDGNASLLEKLNIIVDGIDKQNKNLVSDFVYSLKDFARVVNSHRETVADSDELVNNYFTGLKSFISRFENIDKNTNPMTLANDLIADLRTMDTVIKSIDDNEYSGVGIHFGLTSSVRMGLEYYKLMYDANMIADVIDQIAYFLPEDYKSLGATLSDCANIIYLEFTKSAPDYIELISELCDKLCVDASYYIEQYNSGELHLFEDFVYSIFEKYYSNSLNTQEPLTSENDSLLAIVNNVCKYLDTLFIDGYDRVELLKQIHSIASIYSDGLQEEGEAPQAVMNAVDVVLMLTDTQNNIYNNVQEATQKYQTEINEYISSLLGYLLGVSDENQTLKALVTVHLTAYLNNQFDISDCIGDLNEFIDENCDEDVKAYANSLAILGTIILNDGRNIDYNELLKDIELPNEIKEIDFNKLINETLKDKNTYDIFTLDDVNVEYITNDNGDIIKEIMTVKFNAKYDILISSLDAHFVLTLEIDN